MADDKKNPLGPTGDQVRANVKHIREARGMTKKGLSDRVASLGRLIPPLGISRIEEGARRVDADDLVALALALRVSPLRLLFPSTAYGTQVIELTDKVSASLDDAWNWGAGQKALPSAPGGTVTPEQQADYLIHGLPEGRRRIAQHPDGRSLRDATEVVNRLILEVDAARFPDTYDADAEYAKSLLTRVIADVDHLKLEHDRVSSQALDFENQEAAEHDRLPRHEHKPVPPAVDEEGGDG